MVQLKFFLLVSFVHAASCEIGRTGFITTSKQWDDVIGKNEEEAKEYIRKEFPEADFLVVDEETYHIIPPEGHMYQVLMSVSLIGEVKFPAKYTGYVPNFEFAKDFIGIPYDEAVESLKMRLPSCMIVVVQNGKTVYSCCQREYDDYVRLEVDANGLLLRLPVFVPHEPED